jgi:hypothetical protein
MLKRRGGPQAPPTRPPAHRTRTTDVSAGARSAETPPSSRAAWLSAPGVTARERAAADHYARLVHAHLQCQVCQEALRARLHHQRRLGVQCCGRRRAVSPPPPPPPPPALAQLTAAAAATTALDDVTTEASVAPETASFCVRVLEKTITQNLNFTGRPLGGFLFPGRFGRNHRAPGAGAHSRDGMETPHSRW